MKKAIAVILAIAVVLMGLAACGKTNNMYHIIHLKSMG